MGKIKTKVLFKHVFFVSLLLFIVAFLTVVVIFIYRYDVITRAAKHVIKQTAQDSNKHVHLLVLANVNESLVTTGVDKGVYFEYPNGVAVKSSWITKSSDAGILVFKQNSEFKVVHRFSSVHHDESDDHLHQNVSYQIINAFSSLHNGIHFDKKSVTLTEIFGESNHVITSQNSKFKSLGILLIDEQNRDKFISLSDLGINTINLESVNYKTKDLHYGDLQLATLSISSSSKLNNIYEIDLLNDPSDWIYHLNLNVQVSPSFSPNSAGGHGLSLDDAIALSPKLHQLVQTYSSGIDRSDNIIQNIINTWADTFSSLRKTLADDLMNDHGSGMRTNLSKEDIAKLKVLEQFTGDYGAVQNFKLPITQISKQLNTNKMVTPTEIFFESGAVSKGYQELVDSVVKLLVNYNEFSSDHTSQLIIKY